MRISKKIAAVCTIDGCIRRGAKVGEVIGLLNHQLNLNRIYIFDIDFNWEASNSDMASRL